MIAWNRIVASWNDTLLNILSVATQPTSLGLGPPPVARSLAIIYTSAYDAWAAYNAFANPVYLNSPSRQPPPTYGDNQKKGIAISYAIYTAAVDLFPDPVLKAMLDAKMSSLGLSLVPAAGDPEAANGVQAATAVLSNRRGPVADDGSNQANNYADTTGFVPPNPAALVTAASSRNGTPFPSLWQPLTYFNPPSDRLRTPGFITPQWGSLPTFAADTGTLVAALPPPAKATEERYISQARHVMAIQANLTPRQKVIAEYWADGPKSVLPPGHWCSFSAFVSERADSFSNYKPQSLDQDVVLFFAVANAVFDASIVCWAAKLNFVSARPVTAIRWLFAGHIVQGWLGPDGGMGPIAGEMWRPFQKDTFPTPPFPEYVSGHSAFSMAAAVVLQAVTGSNRFGGGFLHTGPLVAEPNIPQANVSLHWATFTEAALEAGESRLFGGIHFHEGNVQGLRLGQAVGIAVWNRVVNLLADPARKSISTSDVSEFGVIAQASS